MTLTYFKHRIINLTVLAVAALLTSSASARQIENWKLYEQLGQNFAAYHNARDVESMDGLIDIKAFSKKVAATVFDDERDRRDYAAGLQKGFKDTSFSKQLFVESIPAEFNTVYLGLKDSRYPILRVDHANGGSEYIKLFARLDGRGRLRINDFYTGSSGRLTSVSMGAVSQLMLRPSESIIKRLFGKVDVDKALIGQFVELGKLRAEGKLLEAYEIVVALPDTLRHRVEMLHLSISLAGFLDDDLYREELALLAQHHGDDPGLAFLLIDHYFYEQQWDKAIKATTTSRDYWLDDGSFNLIFSQLFFESGDLQQSVMYARRALEVEPDYEDGYWNVVDKLSRSGDFNGVVNALDVLVDNYGYEFTDEYFASEPLYQTLLESKLFREWASHNIVSSAD
ncbi:tetratricopeptide repeat protein [Arenicella xantha]|uniref:Tetratricopeptide repeat protein n=1 Tax=Arenicella xantha TaxID=644221 RepID=A0A395JPN0_9GAMM|nr:hypothetical protein [Arenicella xantha]RBP51757.1 hypothetical protein DFR28_1021190 [Arenicella xantha]